MRTSRSIASIDRSTTLAKVENALWGDDRRKSTPKTKTKAKASIMAGGKRESVLLLGVKRLDMIAALEEKPRYSCFVVSPCTFTTFCRHVDFGRSF